MSKKLARLTSRKPAPRLLRAAVILAMATAIAGGMAAVRAAGQYPLDLALDVAARADTIAITSVVSIHVDRLMEESRRKRVTDALRYSGYANFLTALRSIPPVGTITLANRSVDIRYAYEPPDERVRRLVLVGDQPLFFLGDASTKPRAGYELTLVELRFDDKAGVTGRIAGAARIKPLGDGAVGIDEYAETPVDVTVRANRP
jgi:hypothetical protein